MMIMVQAQFINGRGTSLPIQRLQLRGLFLLIQNRASTGFAIMEIQKISMEK